MEDTARISQRLEALRTWRDGSGLSDSERVAIDHAVLTRIAESGATDPDGVARACGTNRVARDYAGQMAAVLQALESGDPSLSGPASGGANESNLPPFAPMDMSHRLDLSRAGRISARAANGTFELSWPAPELPPNSVVLYRVNCSHDGPPSSPDGDIEVAQPTQPTAVDSRPFTRAVRYYRVWANVGSDAARARGGQPILVAEGAEVGPVQDPIIQEQHGQVVGSWQTPQDAMSVVVYRHEPGTSYNPSHRLRSDERTEEEQLVGFLDLTGEPGKQYQYSVCVKARVANGVTESAPFSQVVEIPARPAKVTDLTVEQRDSPSGTGTLLDFSWTRPPAGVVRIYLSDELPSEDLDRQPLDASALQTTPLRTAAIHPVDHRDGRCSMRSVPWPTDWFIVHVTPVTFVGNKVQVGKTVSVKPRMNEITEAEIREHVDSQVVVFGWPDGAGEVAAYVTLHGQPFDPEGQPNAWISEEDWRALGGMKLKLDGGDMDVHLVPRAWLDNAALHGQAVVLHHVGIACLRYEIRYGMKKRRFRNPERDGTLTVLVTAEQEIPQKVRFSLIYDGSSLPLVDRPGSELQVSPAATFAAGQTREVMRVERLPREGWIRLFAAPTSATQQLALLDPPVQHLRLMP